ncbi:hypothetical protein CHS0354_026539 [Potamilus streckersoni]|uniref:P21-activated protein kinase-interacting protein 1-like n=1 Tax=Potamilus streckersoni TaxID=2493646 RepID=A0AAE0VH04_9BIVA|nr:hypothetical protein CHS0354_026539 [Potamilus streckersoni]
MLIVVGTYDEILLGYNVVLVGESYQLEQVFSDHSHTGCIKTLAVSQKDVLASGSTDETIHLFNLRKLRELGTLMEHTGTITWLEFYKGSHMFSCSEDGNLCIWKNFTWECLRTLKGHKSAVNCVSVHPSGKLALTVGKDKTLRTWNLLTGRSAYITNIKKDADIVKWTPDGEMYIIICSNQITLYSVKSTTPLQETKITGKINSVDFWGNEHLVCGGEGGQVEFFDIKNNKIVHTLDTKCSRIRGLCVKKSCSEDKEALHTLIIASSDGFIRLFHIDQSQGKITSKLVAEHNTTFRLTCLTVYEPASDKGIDNKIVSESAEKQTNKLSDIQDVKDNTHKSGKTKKRKCKTKGSNKDHESKQHHGKSGPPSVHTDSQEPPKKKKKAQKPSETSKELDISHSIEKKKKFKKDVQMKELSLKKVQQKMLSSEIKEKVQMKELSIKKVKREEMSSIE